MTLTGKEFSTAEQLYRQIESAEKLRDEMSNGALFLGWESNEDINTPFNPNYHGSEQLHEHLKDECERFMKLLIKKTETRIDKLKTELGKLISDYN